MEREAAHDAQALSPQAQAQAHEPSFVPLRPGQHLLKHAVTRETMAKAYGAFDTSNPHEAGQKIWTLRQPELRAMFLTVFGTPTSSGNNDWMRSKLLQAVGLEGRWRPPQMQGAAAAADDDGAHSSHNTSNASDGTALPGSTSRRASIRMRRQPAALQDSSDDDSERPSRSQLPGRKVAAAHAKPSSPCAAAKRTRLNSSSAAMEEEQRSARVGPSQPPVLVVVVPPDGRPPSWVGGSGSPRTAAAVEAAVSGLHRESLQQAADGSARIACSAGLAGLPPHLRGRLVQVHMAEQGSDPAGSLAERAAHTALQALGYLPSDRREPACSWAELQSSRGGTAAAAALQQQRSNLPSMHLGGAVQQRLLERATMLHARQLQGLVPQPAASQPTMQELQAAAAAAPGEVGKQGGANMTTQQPLEQYLSLWAHHTLAKQPDSSTLAGADAAHGHFAASAAVSLPAPALRARHPQLLKLPAIGASGAVTTAAASLLDSGDTSQPSPLPANPNEDLQRLYQAWNDDRAGRGA